METGPQEDAANVCKCDPQDPASTVFASLNRRRQLFGHALQEVGCPHLWKAPHDKHVESFESLEPQKPPATIPKHFLAAAMRAASAVSHGAWKYVLAKHSKRSKENETFVETIEYRLRLILFSQTPRNKDKITSDLIWDFSGFLYWIRRK